MYIIYRSIFVPNLSIYVSIYVHNLSIYLYILNKAEKIITSGRKSIQINLQTSDK